MKDKTPWSFCKTPEEKCTMNYCDDNGCQNRKRNHVKVSDVKIGVIGNAMTGIAGRGIIITKKLTAAFIEGEKKRTITQRHPTNFFFEGSQSNRNRR